MTTLNLQVGASARDGDQDHSGLNGSITRTVIPLGSFSGNAHQGAASFQVNIAQGTTITSATLKLKASDTYSTGSTISIIAYAEDVDNSAALTSANSNQSGRTRTTANSGAVSIASVTAESDYSWDVTAALQEVLDRPGFVANNFVTFILRDNSSTLNEWQEFYSYDNTPSKAPTLDIVYSSGGDTAQVDETGAGADTAAGAYVSTQADTGTGSDATSGVYAGTQADTGTGSDAISAQHAATTADTGSGADAIGSAQLGATVADTGGSSETATGTLVGALDEAGTGSDGQTAQLGASLSDTGAGADATAGSGAGTVGETGSGADAALAQLGAAVDDTGTGSEAVSGAYEALLAETGTGVDAASAPGGGAVSDTGAGADTASAEYQAALSEAGAGVDAVSGALTALLVDSGAGADSAYVVGPVVGTPSAVVAQRLPRAVVEAVTKPEALIAKGSWNAVVVVVKPIAVVTEASMPEAEIEVI